MIRDLEDVRGGFERSADAVVVGSGAGGAAAALALAEAGLDVVVVEAGPRVRSEDLGMRDGPRFLSRYYWEGGLRMVLGSGAWPVMSGRALGGSTVVNSAIQFRLPDWVREDWITTGGLAHLRGPALDAAYDRVFGRLGVGPTAEEALGRKDHVTRDVLTAAGVPNGPLPRAVVGCRGSGSCLTSCPSGAKQSVDRSYLPDAVRHGAEVFTCAPVERLLFEGGRAVGVTGTVTEPFTREPLGAFTVRAPRVFLAAGTMHTPVLLQRSGVTLGGRVGGSFQAHISGLALGVMPERVDPWRGATQGWGGFSDRVQGLKFESLWAPTALIAAEWGGLGHDLARMLPDFGHAAMIVMVYRAPVSGSVRARRNGMPDVRMWVPPSAIHTVMGEVHRVTTAFLDQGARYVFTGVKTVPERITTRDQADALLDRRIRGRHVTMTCNHTFGSCPMGPDADRAVVGLDGRVHGVPGVWITDASVFPSPSAVNPQATVMALADLTARQAADRDVA